MACNTVYSNLSGMPLLSCVLWWMTAHVNLKSQTNIINIVLTWWVFFLVFFFWVFLNSFSNHWPQVLEVSRLAKLTIYHSFNFILKLKASTTYVYVGLVIFFLWCIFLRVILFLKRLYSTYNQYIFLILFKISKITPINL